MKKYILQNHAGHKFPQEGKSLEDAKIKLCKRLGYETNCSDTGVNTVKLCEVIKC